MYINRKRFVSENDKLEFMLVPEVQEDIIDNQVISLLEYQLDKNNDDLNNNINTNWQLLELAEIKRDYIYHLVDSRKHKYYSEKIKNLTFDLRQAERTLEIVSDNYDLVALYKKDIFNIKQQLNKLINTN